MRLCRCSRIYSDVVAGNEHLGRAAHQGLPAAAAAQWRAFLQDGPGLAAASQRGYLA